MSTNLVDKTTGELVTLASGVRCWIGTKTAHDLAGGEKDIAVYLIANENAVPFYEKLGMEKSNDVMQYNHIEWTGFTVQ